MPEHFQLRRIHADSVARTLDRARHYRLLNDPKQAESICLDVLEVAPDEPRALTILILALTDMFSSDDGIPGANRVRTLVGRLTDPYERAYYAGIVSERMARAYLTRTWSRGFAYEAFREAMARYEEAEALRPTGNDDPLLRWNSCARTIMQERLEPSPETGEPPLE